MSTFFKVCIYICLGLICFNLALIFISSLNVFPYTQSVGQGTDVDTAVSTYSGYTDYPSMDVLLIAILGGSIGAFGLSILTQSWIPVGIALFGSVFWGSYIGTVGVIQRAFGEFIPWELHMIFLVVMIFMFIAAVIGMIIGSG